MNQLLGCLSWRTVAACSPSSTVELPTGLLPNQPAKPGLPAGLYFSSGKYESGNMNINSSPKNASTQLSQCFSCTHTHYSDYITNEKNNRPFHSLLSSSSFDIY